MFVGDEAIYQGQRVKIVYEVNGDEVVIQLPDGTRKPVSDRELSAVPGPAAPRPMIAKDMGEVLPPAPPESTAPDASANVAPEETTAATSTPPPEVTPVPETAAEVPPTPAADTDNSGSASS